MTRTSARSRVMIAGLAATLAVGLIAGPAFAGKSGGSGGGGHKTTSGGTFAVRLLTDNDGDGSITWGDVVTYDVSKVTVMNPVISTTCTQNRTMVLSTWAGYYDGYMWPAAQNILLKTEYWTGGAASCTGVSPAPLRRSPST